MNLVIIFVSFSRKAAAVHDLITAWVAQLDAVSVTLVEVQNAADADMSSQCHEENHRHILIRGDNRAWEFSGWDAGVQKILTDESLSPDLVVLTNDALLNSKNAGNIFYLNSRALQWIVEDERSVVGWVDSLDEVMRRPFFTKRYDAKLRGRRIIYWVCTAFIAFPWSVLKGLGRVATLDESSDKFLMSVELAGEIGVSEGLLAVLRDHQQRIWRASERPRDDLQKFIPGKARSVLNEFALSVRLREKGIAFIDFRILGQNIFLALKGRSNFQRFMRVFGRRYRVTRKGFKSIALDFASKVPCSGKLRGN